MKHWHVQSRPLIIAHVFEYASYTYPYTHMISDDRNVSLYIYIYLFILPYIYTKTIRHFVQSVPQSMVHFLRPSTGTFMVQFHKLPDGPDPQWWWCFLSCWSLIFGKDGFKFICCFFSSDLFERNLRRWIRLFRDNQIESTCWYEHPPAVSTCVALTYHTRFCSTNSSTCSTDGDEERLWVGYTNTKTSSVVECLHSLSSSK